MTDLHKMTAQAHKVGKKFRPGSIRNLAVRASHFKPKPRTQLAIDSIFRNLLKKAQDSKLQMVKKKTDEVTEGFRQLQKQRMSQQPMASELKAQAQRPVESESIILKETDLSNLKTKNMVEKPQKYDPDFSFVFAFKTTKNEFKRANFNQNRPSNDEEICRITEQEKTKKSSFESKRLFKNNQLNPKINSKTVNRRPADTEASSIIKYFKQIPSPRGPLSQRPENSQKRNQNGRRSLNKFEALLSKRGQDGIADTDDPGLISYVGNRVTEDFPRQERTGRD